MRATASGGGLARHLPSLRRVERMSYKYIDMHQAVNIRQSSSTGKAKTLWKIREAKANGDAHYEQGSEGQIESRVAVRQALWEAHLRSQVSALEEALRRTEVGAERAVSSTAGGSTV